jgi:hypothetical protein
MTPKYAAQRTNRRLRKGSFDSVAALTDANHVWAAHWNDDPKPFGWHKTAKDIITRVRRGRAALTHHTKSATPRSSRRSSSVAVETAYRLL